MRNLTVHSRAGRSLEHLTDQLTRASKALCAVDPNNDDFYCLIGDRLHFMPSDFRRETISAKITENATDRAVGLEFCLITQRLFCAYESGDVFSVDTESNFNCEFVTRINDGLQCMSISPDHEILVFVTNSGNVVTTLSGCEIMSEVNLHSSEFGQKQFVTVGWGKKETQFHGSEGKAAALAKPVQIDRNEGDDGLARISWRGDGSLFAVSFVKSDNNARQFKVFNREGILQYTSELVSGLEELVSWKPSGSLIAATQRLANKHVVALFEKNGLKHRDFTLPFGAKEIMVKELFWSPDSDILTVWCEKPESNLAVLQLWTENNYHWYLKETITFCKDKNPLLYATWSSAARSGKKLIFLTLKELATCSFHWTINHSRGNNSNDKAVVGVIDGNNALLTGFRVGIVPPPMAHQTLKLEEPVNAIVFAPNVEDKESWIDSNAFFCVSNNDTLTFYQHVTDSSLLEYKCIGSHKVTWDIPEINTQDFLYSAHHFLWLTKHTVLCSVSLNDHSLLCVLTLNGELGKDACIIVQETHIMDGVIQHIIPSPDIKIAYIIVEGSVLKYTENEGLDPTDITIEELSYKVEVVQIGKQHTVISLSHRNCLSIDGKEIANNITSFYVHSEFLLLTTSQHTLICVTLDHNGIQQLVKQDLTVKPWENNLNEQFSDLNVRRVERGSRLVIAISKDSKTILQMPRGNLECIQPRALSLHIIGFYLDNLEYLSAFDLMRKQRINLNLIYDHDPVLFERNAEKFVKDVAKPSWLSLFLSELNNEDVTRTTYANCYLNRRMKSDNNTKNKVERVCELLRNIMEDTIDKDKLIQPILISLVKNQEKHGLEDALKRIKEVKILEDCKERVPLISAEEALKYLLYLVDVNVLFDVALGMYDFDLTMFVASKSQKDPKEYIPFLNDLKRLDENYMKYSIDMHLKRYESALKHISKEPSRFNECMSLIRNQNLYMKGLKLFHRDSYEYKDIAGAYGEYLFSKRKYQEAAIMFRKCDDFYNALNAHKLAGNWQEAIVVSKEMKLSSSECGILYKDLVERLKNDRKYYEAAQISITYLNDPEEAIALFCSGRCWKDALRISHDVQRLDLIATYVKTNVYKHADYVMCQISKNMEDFERHKARLATVRHEMSTKQTRIYDDEICDSTFTSSKDISDLLSDTSSIASSVLSQKSRMSSASGRSYRSSKNRRKQERKLLSLKEGSAFEDLGLIRALHQIITTTYKQKDEMRSVLQMLMYFNLDDIAEKFQSCMNNFLQLIERSKSEIWDKSAPSSISETDTSAIQPQESVIPQKLIDQHVMYPPEANSQEWKLDIF